MKIPVIINNFNLLTWPKKMVEVIKTWENVGEIIILDNGSTYEPLLEWYKTNPCRIVNLDNNFGHLAAWRSGFVESSGFDFYVVTDPDLGLEDVPKDVLNVLFEKLNNHPHYVKIGLSILDYLNPKIGVPHYHHMLQLGKTFWELSGKNDGLLLDHRVDTTFAMYKSSEIFSGPNCCLDYPYSVIHHPFHITRDELDNLDKNNPEFFYYLKQAHTSSTYKSFTEFNRIHPD